ncbi:MAG TPA: HlyD family secretion protein [Blastocatellia bacterium]|nr:HlyD family secretion protein [Blastocatellia bacterium]
MPKVIDEINSTETNRSDEIIIPEMDDHQLEAMMREDASPTEPGEPAKTKKPFYKRARLMIVASVFLIAGLFFGARYYAYASAHESTDDAFIEGHVIQISPKVTGHISQVFIEENQQVKKGDLLAEIDARDYEARLAQARAALEAAVSKQQAAQINVGLTSTTSGANVQQASSGVEMAKSGVETARGQVAVSRGRVEQARAQVATAESNAAQAQAQVTAAEAEATRANADRQRYQQLYDNEVVSRQQLDFAVAQARSSSASLEAARKKAAATEAQIQEARAALDAAQANLQQTQSQVSAAQAQVGEASGKLAAANAAPQQVAQSRAQVETAGADIEQARAAVAQAELNLSYTKIYAPEDGRVTKKSVEAGAFVQVGQALMAVVPDEVWVVANFKETQLDNIRPGQPVDIKVDAYSGKTFKGHVDSIQTGTGARFSLLPPENATGNYVKVVQRVPVKIVFDEQPDPQYPIGPGMSVEPEVKVK